jgi:predicted permease
MTRKPFRRLFQVRASSADVAVDDELEFHIATRTDELIAAGLPRDDARASAEREFGDRARYRDDVLKIERQVRAERQVRELAGSMAGDVRYALRSLASNRAFAFVAVLTLALGVGATTAVSSAVRGVLLRPLPYRDADRIVHIGEREITKPGRGGTTSYDNFVDYRARSRGFEAMGLYNTWQSTLTGHGNPERVRIAGVSAGLFDVFGVTPAIGRRFTDQDNVDRAASVAVVSDAFWRAHLGGDRAIVGQTILLNFAPVQVVGVLPPGFAPPGDLDRPIWVNFSDDTDGRGGRSKTVYAKLRAGVTRDQAQRELTAIAEQLAKEYPANDKGSTAVVDGVSDLLVGDLRRPLYALLGASLLVLLIACANLSNLLLARGVMRKRELAVRAAIGASRGRLIRQLLTESAVLALIGIAGGFGIAFAAAHWLSIAGPAAFTTRPPSLDATVLLAAALVSLAVVLAFGLLPALRSAPRNAGLALREASARGGGSRIARMRIVLAVVQLSLAITLLATTGLVMKSFWRVLRTEPGVRGDHLLTMAVNLPRARYDSSKSTIFYEQLADRVSRTPGVRGVAFTSLVPFGGDFDRIGISRIAGEPERSGSDMPEGDRYIVSPGYFDAMGIRLVRGRLLERGDRFDGQPVCLVDEVFAKRTFGERNPIGIAMQLPGRKDPATIVGVVSHVKTYGLDVASPGQIYMSNAQYPWRWMSMVVHTAGEPADFAPTATSIVHELDRDEPVSDVRTMEDLMGAMLRQRRFTLALFGAFSVVATALAIVGLYGVIEYGMEQRRREFGVRIALGAKPAQIARLVLGESAWTCLAGLVIGCTGAMLAGRLLGTMLFEVSPRDLSVLGGTCAVLVVAALAASLGPARRAVRVDPATVLRGD